MNAADPARQVTLIRKTCVCRDFGQAGASFPNARDRGLQAQMHHVTVRRHANGSGEHPREMKRTSTGKIGKFCDIDRLRKMRKDIFSNALEHLLAQRAPAQAVRNRCVTEDQAGNKAASASLQNSGPLG